MLGLRSWTGRELQRRGPAAANVLSPCDETRLSVMNSCSLQFCLSLMVFFKVATRLANVDSEKSSVNLKVESGPGKLLKSEKSRVECVLACGWLPQVVQ